MSAIRAVKQTTDNPELAERFNRVLGETVAAMEESGLQYVFIGGIASGGLGRPRATHDIDIFVRPEDAKLALRALAKHGFKTEETDPVWLYKGFKENILVDVIFKSKGEIYLDSELYQRSIRAEFHGKQLRLVAPEDLIIIKAAAHSELTPGHWHDALALLAHANLDWDYLVRRARKAPRRVLSLFVYAHSADIFVPKNVIDDLYRACFGEMPVAPVGATKVSYGAGQGPAAQQTKTAPRALPQRQDIYSISHLRERLAEDTRTNELDIDIEQAEDKILLRGEVLTSARRDSVAQIARESFPNHQIENQIRVLNFNEPTGVEEVK